MSKTIKFTLSDENYEDLIRTTVASGYSSVQDYIRSILFPGQIDITPLDAVQKALSKYKTGEKFSVPEIYGTDWNIPNGMAGVFGRKFFSLVSKDYSAQIKFTGKHNKKQQAVYERL